MAARVQRCTDFLRTFRKSFHTEKVAREREGIEAKAYAPPDLSGVDRFLSDATIGMLCYCLCSYELMLECWRDATQRMLCMSCMMTYIIQRSAATISCNDQLQSTAMDRI